MAPARHAAPIDDVSDRLGARIAEALRAACHPRGVLSTSVGVMDATGVLLAVGDVAAAGTVAAPATAVDADALVVRLFREHASSLVRLVRLFVDDRNAAEDLVQEAFIRLSRSAHRIEDPDRAAAYLRSIVLNLARDHNRRGLVSLRHHLPFDDDEASLEDEVVLREDQQRVIEALRTLPHRQRDCVVLRYYFDLGIADIAATIGVSPNSVKTHLRRGMAALERRLGAEHAPDGEVVR